MHEVNNTKVKQNASAIPPIMSGDWKTTAMGTLATTFATRNTPYMLAVKAEAHLPTTRVNTPRNSTGRRPILKHKQVIFCTIMLALPNATLCLKITRYSGFITKYSM